MLASIARPAFGAARTARATRTAVSASRNANLGLRFNSTSPHEIKKVLCVLYSGGKHASEEAKLLGTIENKLGLEKWFKEQNIEFVVTADKEGPNSVFQKELPTADVLITTPFHPAYVTADLIEKAPNLKLCVTAGVGSDHVDLTAANKHKIMVAEVTGSNVTSVAEHAVMTMLNLVRNSIPAHQQVAAGEWDVGAIARNAYDLEGKVVGTFGCGRIGSRILQRLQGFGCKELVYFDYSLPKELNVPGARRIEDFDEFVRSCDVITINAPLHEGTKGLFDSKVIGNMKKGSWLVNTARGAICNRQAVVDALASGHLRGYGGDVWDVQPAPREHPWRYMANPLGGGNDMTPHYSGTTLDAQARYAEGTKEIIRRWQKGETQVPANVIVADGEYATRSYGSDKKVKDTK